MKLIVGLLVAGISAVILTISQPPKLVGCPYPEPEIIRHEDGTYTRPIRSGMTLQACYSEGSNWQEEWTDYPEKGGTFIRRVPERTE